VRRSGPRSPPDRLRTASPRSPRTPGAPARA
jgi:hypothetical protein